MIQFWEIVKALIIGLFFGFFIVLANKSVMENYKQEYQDWWTTKRYRILFVITVTIITIVYLIGYAFFA
jgi:H+/Cl- antiporter ClcA